MPRKAHALPRIVLAAWVLVAQGGGPFASAEPSETPREPEAQESEAVRPNGDSPRRERGRDARASDPDQDLIDHLEIIERMELLQNLELFDTRADAPRQRGT